MNIDFHYGLVYVVSRLGGLNAADAETVAHACQYVDDSTTPGVLEFAEGQTFDRFASAHSMLDYANLEDSQDRLVWAPFHFLPGNEGGSFDERVVCRPNSLVAQEMVRRFLTRKRQDNALHSLGITLHTYVDTWAHQGFSGTRSDRNRVTKLNGHEHEASTWKSKLKTLLATVAGRSETDVADLLVKVGHGGALHFPDMPWAKWTYTNGVGEDVTRDNLPQFLEAAKKAYKVVSAFIAVSSDVDGQSDMSDQHVAVIQKTLAENQSHDGAERLVELAKRLGNGSIPAIPEAIPPYIAKGPGSWKHKATGLESIDDGHHAPEWTAEFEKSDYRKFHDAVKEHRTQVTQFLLPKFGLRLA